tara:strand:+ start:234 stop:521 length:288 start_codon:yes stop_codon:yes gene_type:complete
MRDAGNHQEVIDFDYYEIEEGKFVDLKLSIDYDITNCECTSMHGEQSVSEHWQEIDLNHWDIEEIRFIESHDFPINYTHKQKIEGDINEYIHDNY